MAPVKPFMQKKSLKERMIASGKKSKNVIDVRDSKEKNPAVSASKNPVSVLRKAPGPVGKMSKANQKLDTKGFSKKGPKPKV